jgi:hypothetical protein
MSEHDRLHVRMPPVDGLMREDGAAGFLARLAPVALHQDQVADLQRLAIRWVGVIRNESSPSRAEKLPSVLMNSRCRQPRRRNSCNCRRNSCSWPWPDDG